MKLNKCQLDEIKSKAENGDATSADCLALLDHYGEEFTDDFMTEVHLKIESAIEDEFRQISTQNIASAVERAIMRMKK